MNCRYVLVAALAIGGCATSSGIQVKTLHPSPRALTPRAADTVKVYDSRPEGAVAVYALEASGGDKAKIEAAVQAKAAALGCDGIMYTVRQDQTTSSGVESTGQLNAHREYIAARISGLCMVLDASAVAPPAAASPPAATSMPAAPAPSGGNGASQ